MLHRDVRRSDIEASDSEEIEIYNRINVKPYDMEPRRKCEHGEVEVMTPCSFPSLLSENERVLFTTNMSLCSFHLQRTEFINIKPHNS